MRVIPAARDQKTLEVLDGSPVGALVVGWFDMLGVEVEAKSRELSVVGSTEKRVSGTVAW